MKANKGRVRVYDANEVARGIRETFTAKPVRETISLPFTWPTQLHNVGDSLAVAYASDKWKKDGDMELYKHLAESRNRVLCLPGLLHSYHDPSEKWAMIGPMVSLADVPMPKHVAILGLFEEANLKLYTGGTDEDPEFGDEEDDGVVKVAVKHGMLCASMIRWSEVSNQPDQPFLAVYTEDEGVHMIIVGDELDVEKDGIVG